jgi:hypothetical protein
MVLVLLVPIRPVIQVEIIMVLPLHMDLRLIVRLMVEVEVVVIHRMVMMNTLKRLSRLKSE